MKKTIILVSFLAIAGFIGFTEAAPRDSMFVTKTSINDGDTRNGVYVSVSSTTWTTVLSANTRRRHALLQTLTPQNGTVCLSTTSTSYPTCSATAPGVRLSTSATYDDYSEAILYGRVEDAKSGTVLIYGFEYYDSTDSTSFQ